MSLQPIFPQFSAACAEFALTEGFPRPFAALDWCPRCGQPDWARQAGSNERLSRLHHLDPDDMTDALAYLAEYSPATLDTILDGIIDTPAPVQGSDLDEELFCATCNAPLGVFTADGPYYRPYQQHGDDGETRRNSVDHPTVIAWRQPTRP